MPTPSRKKGVKDWNGNRCVLCNEQRTVDGHDPCIANLPGVLYACCGHGNADGYIKFSDGRCLRFQPTEVDVDIPSVKTRFVEHGKVKIVPIFQMGAHRIFDFKTAKVRIKRFSNSRKAPS